MTFSEFQQYPIPSRLCLQMMNDDKGLLLQILPAEPCVMVKRPPLYFFVPALPVCNATRGMEIVILTSFQQLSRLLGYSMERHDLLRPCTELYQVPTHHGHLHNTTSEDTRTPEIISDPPRPGLCW